MAITSPTLQALRRLISGEGEFDFRSRETAPNPTGSAGSGLPSTGTANPTVPTRGAGPDPGSREGQAAAARGAGVSGGVTFNSAPWSGDYTGAPQPGQINPWTNFAPFGGRDPFLRNVTLPTAMNGPDGDLVMGPPHYSSTPSMGNVNYASAAGADTASRATGLPVVYQDMNQSFGPAGRPSDPIAYLGREDGIPAGQVAFMIARGDTPEMMARDVNNRW